MANINPHKKARKKWHILAMGGGVNTTSCLLKYWERYGYVVFSDTGAEHKETYEYMDNYLKPFCKSKKIPWATVRHKNEYTLEEFCWNTKRIPLIQQRWCTADFKIRPINKFIHYTLCCHRKNPCRVDIGIAYDEAHRARLDRVGEYPKYVVNEYPLIDDKIDREGCKDIIREHGWPLPPKSGCDFCMFKPKEEWIKMKENDPKRFAEILALERNGAKYPRITLKYRTPLEEYIKIKSVGEESTTCERGYCFR